MYQVGRSRVSHTAERCSSGTDGCWVPDALVARFRAVLPAREAAMLCAPGFQGLTVAELQGEEQGEARVCQVGRVRAPLCLQS